MTQQNKPKLPEADREAARVLALQLKESRTERRWDRALCAAFLAAIFVFAILFWALPDRDLSERENRKLAQLPRVTWDTVKKGKFSSDVAAYMADQFPARDFFITLKAASETALGKMGNNGVLFGEGETLVTREDAPDLDNLRVNWHAISAFSDYLGAHGIPVTAAVAGRTADVLDGTLPAFYGSESSDALWGAFSRVAAEEGKSALDLRTPLRARAAAGEYVYYRTDHHWTTLGAYYGYAEIASSLGIAPYPLDAFTRETASDAFYGTTWSTAGASWISPDMLEYFRFDGDGDYTTVIADTGRSFAGFYDRAYLDVKDKYSSFLGGNSALVTVTKNGGEAREKLLIVKDSFAHAAAPFLARHFDLVIADVRYYKQSVAALALTEGVDRVLILYNIDSLTASSAARMLEAGLG